MNVIGDRWILLILREAFLGRHRFEEFRFHTGASRGTLSKRLEWMVFNGIFYKNPYQTSPLRFEYRLTDKGLGLYPAALLIWRWEMTWAGEQYTDMPRKLYHHEGRKHILKAICICRHCKQEVFYDDVERVVTEHRPPLPLQSLSAFGKQRRTKGDPNRGQVLDHIADILGDRWTLLLIAATFVGMSRYDDFHNQLSIATNILADRLKLLVEMKIFSRHQYQSNPPRHEYRLTEKGKSLYPQTITLRQWALDWLPKVVHPFKLVHRTCGAELATDVVCEKCGIKPEAGKVSFSD